MKELDLYPSIINNFQKESNFKVIHELHSGYGIADIVFFKLKRGKTKLDEAELGGYRLNAIKLLLKLRQSPKDKVALTTYEYLLPQRKKDKVKIVSYLAERDYIELLDKNTIQIKKRYNIGLKEAIAIEAKLENWQRGLYQAYRYKSFANQSYLALHTKHIHNAIGNLELFKRRNVGLIEVKKDSIEIIHSPIRENLQNNIFSAIAYENILRKEYV